MMQLLRCGTFSSFLNVLLFPIHRIQGQRPGTLLVDTTFAKHVDTNPNIKNGQGKANLHKSKHFRFFVKGYHIT